MKHSLNIGKEPSLQKIVIASAVLHLLFITLVVIPIKTKEREFRSYFVNLVGPIQTPGTGQIPSIKRQRRTVPRKKIIRTPRKADMSLERADKVTKEIDRIRAISALSKKKKQREKEKAKEIEIIRKKVAEDVSKGSGIPGTGIDTDLDPYYAFIRQKIWSHWLYPDFDTEGLEVIISIKINKNGKVIFQEIEKSSGNALFDRSALKAISKASPLPPPPIEMEIGVRFYL